MRVYMDNAATSFPKPREVTDAMIRYMIHNGTSISRSTSVEATDTSEKIYMLRKTLSDFFHAEDAKNVIFTKNITEALNIIIKGYIKPKDKVMISALEHNAVTRPLVQQGAEILTIPVSPEGELDLNFIEKHIEKVKAVFCIHVSNVSGDVMPISDISTICSKNHVPFIVDAAQSAGIIPINLEKTKVDCLCFTGHKSLLGPTGTGGMLITSEFAKDIPPFITGGTGSQSDSEKHPLLLPDKYEAGTPNIVGLIGLLEGVRAIEKMGIENRFAQETVLGQKFYQWIEPIKGVSMIGSSDYARKVPVFSLDFKHLDNADISFILAQKYGIDNRCGIHCAPRAHQTYQTFPRGTVRLSMSHRTTEEELLYVKNAILEIVK